MDQIYKKYLICAVLLICVCSIHGSVDYNFDSTHASSLEAALGTSYHTFVRPDVITPVYLNFGITHITKLDIVDQKFYVNGFLIIYWVDHRLQWTPKTYGSMTKTFLSLSNIWNPPIVLNNAAESINIISDNSDLSSVPVAVYSTGKCYWLAPVSFVSHCTINIQFYPFDIQTCDLLVTTWMYMSSEVDLKTFSEPGIINTDLYEENGEWDLVESNVTEVSRVLEGYTMPAVKFSIKLERKYSYYLLNMVLPVIFLALLGAFVFLLPVECGEKNGFGLTILLSLSVVMTIVSDNIPPVSSSTCILSIYLLTTYILCVVEVLITVINIRIHNLTQLGYKPSNIMQGFMKTVLLKVACYKRARDIEENEKVNNTKLNDQKCTSVSTVANVKFVKAPKTNKAWEPEMEHDNATKDDCVYTYEDLSIMLDKICFVVFLALTVCVTITFLLMLMIGGAQSG